MDSTPDEVSDRLPAWDELTDTSKKVIRQAYSLSAVHGLWLGVHMDHLFAGLYLTDEQTRAAVEKARVGEDDLYEALGKKTAFGIDRGIPAEPSLDHLPELSTHCQEALVAARRSARSKGPFAGGPDYDPIEAHHLLQGFFSVGECDIVKAVSELGIGISVSFRIAMTALSDQPVKTVEEDELDFDVYSGALVDFIRREKTHTPLTLGIDAPWGQGKTSLMKMMRTELERYGLLTVWFNA